MSLLPPLTHKQNSGDILAIWREVLVCRFILRSKNKTQLLVYSLGILEFANAKMCWLDFPGVRKGTVSSETVIKRGLGLGLEKGYRVDKQKGGFRDEPRGSRGWGHKDKLHMEMSQWNP